MDLLRLRMSKAAIQFQLFKLQHCHLQQVIAHVITIQKTVHAAVDAWLVKNYFIKYDLSYHLLYELSFFSIVSIIQWDFHVNSVSQVLVEMRPKELHLTAYQVLLN